jgi:hypothetical protein
MNQTLIKLYYAQLGLTENESETDILHNNYTRQLKDKHYHSQMTLLQEIFCDSKLSYLKKNKQFFIDNKNDPHFQGLIFFCIPQIARDNKPQEKLIFLLDCGYNPNITMNKKNMLFDIVDYKLPNGLEYNVEGLTPLHYFINKATLEILIKYGANPQNTVKMYDYLNEFINESKITKIKNSQDLKKYVDFEFKRFDNTKEETYLVDLSWNPLFMEDRKNHLNYTYLKDKINLWLKLAKEPNLTAYHLGLICENKQKYHYLKIFESQESLKEEEKLAALNILNLFEDNPNKAFKLLSEEVKKTNHYIESHIKEFLPLFQNKTKEIVHHVIRDGSITLLKNLIENQYVVDNNKKNYLETAYKYHKTEAFILLFEHGFKNGLDKISSHISSRLEGEFSSQKLNQVSAGIVYYLSRNGYHFEHSKVIEKLIAHEQTLLQTVESKSVEKNNKKLKI